MLRFCGALSLCLMLFVIAGTQAHAKIAEKEPGLTMLSHYEFVELSQAKRIVYIKALTKLMLDIEKHQEMMGVKYSNAMNTNFLPWFAALLETAEAQTVFAQGKACIFAGGISSYGSTNRLTCINNRKCKDRPNMIECNPMLFGAGACTDARDGATARCVREKKISDAELAQVLAQGENRKQWDEFKNQFDAFCPGVLKLPKDYNYRSCKLVEKQMLAVQKEIDKIPVTKQVAAGPPAPTEIVPKVTPGVCGKAGSGTCLACPAPSLVKDYKDITDADLGADKYSQLVRIMARACGVENAADSGNGPNGVSSKTTAQLVKKFGLCADSEYAGAGKYTKTDFKGEEADPEQQKIITALERGDSAALKELAGGRWLNPPYTDGFQDYFGIGIKEARQAFCSNASPDVAVNLFRGYPDFGFLSGSGNSIAANQLLKDDKWITSIPNEISQQEWNNVDGPPIIAVNKFKKQVMRRQKLADCLAKNTQEPNRRKKLMMVEVPKNCNLLSSNITAEQFNANLSKIIGESENGVCVQDGSGKTPAVCSTCNEKGCGCTRTDLTMPATISWLKCSSAPGAAGKGASASPGSSFTQ